MKGVLAIILSVMLCALVITSCSSTAGKTGLTTGTPSSTVSTVNYKVAIERYFNAYMKADIDTLLDLLDPDGPMYPQPAAIKQLRATASGNALQGEAVVKEITVVEESADKARVKVTLFMRVDFYNNGTFREETSHPTCELRLKDGKWRLFNVEIQ